MKPKERAVMALKLKKPDAVPTWELVFYPTVEAFGECFCKTTDREALFGHDREKAAENNISSLFTHMAG